MTAIKDIIFKGEDIYKITSTGVRTIEICKRSSLREQIKAYHKKIIEKNRGSVARSVCYKCIYLSKLTLSFRFATFALTGNLNVVTYFVCLVIANYFDAQYAMQT